MCHTITKQTHTGNEMFSAEKQRESQLFSRLYLRNLPDKF